MAKKKISYNPFKMWGSWVGGFLYLLLGYFTFKGGTVIGSFIRSNIAFLGRIGDFSLRLILDNNILQIDKHFFFIIILIGIMNFVIGFLIGWVIHSLIRKLIRSKRR